MDVCFSILVAQPDNNTTVKIKNINLSDTSILDSYKDCSSLLINAHETSVGHLYNLDAMGDYSKKNDLLFIVDSISMFVTDPIDMQKQNIDVVIASSQKGLALPPGLTMVILAPKALEKVQDIKSLYFNYKDYLKNNFAKTDDDGQPNFFDDINFRMKAVELFYNIGGFSDDTINIGLPRSVDQLKEILKLRLNPQDTFYIFLNVHDQIQKKRLIMKYLNTNHLEYCSLTNQGSALIQKLVVVGLRKILDLQSK